MPVWRFEAIGTLWEIESSRELTVSERSSVDQVIERFDRDWSRFRPDSTVAALASGGAAALPPDAIEMLDAYRELSLATDGAINPLVGGSLESLGYGNGALLAGEPLPAPSAWSSLLHWTEQLTLTRPAMIDVGALGKGRLVDLVQRALSDVPGDLVVDASGDLVVRGAAVRVGLEHPFDTTKAIGVVTLRDQALCASATNRRAWGSGLHHVLDARTGEPVRTWAATWALAPDAMHADAMATALFFDGGPELAARWGIHWVRMSTDGSVQRSPGCPAELFTGRR